MFAQAHGVFDRAIFDGDDFGAEEDGAAGGSFEEFVGVGPDSAQVASPGWRLKGAPLVMKARRAW